MREGYASGMIIREVGYNRARGPIVEVEVRSPGGVSGKSARISMLIDTGASGTHIRDTVASEVGLVETPLVCPPKGWTLDGQELILKVYSGVLYFVDFGAGFPARMLLSYKNKRSDYDGVIGRDILDQCLLSFEPNCSKFTLGLPEHTGPNFEP